MGVVLVAREEEKTLSKLNSACGVLSYSPKSFDTQIRCVSDAGVKGRVRGSFSIVRSLLLLFFLFNKRFLSELFPVPRQFGLLLRNLLTRNWTSQFSPIPLAPVVLGRIRESTTYASILDCMNVRRAAKRMRSLVSPPHWFDGSHVRYLL